jgi:tRNA threonylcarbamoyl adenosine modification protein (Sua5/YciO/YrdC/YwlC family)
MSQLFQLHPKDPQRRLLRQAADCLRAGGLIVYPTDSCYALGCRDLSEIAKYAKVGTWQYRLLRANTPGPYTFLLQATKEVPRRLQHAKRSTIGIRIPDHRVPQLLLEELGEPLMTSTLLLPGDEFPMTDAVEIHARLGKTVDIVLDGGNCGLEPTTVVDLAGEAPVVVREGRGNPAPFL